MEWSFTIWTATLWQSCKVFTTLQGCKHLAQTATTLSQPCNIVARLLQPWNLHMGDTAKPLHKIGLGNIHIFPWKSCIDGCLGHGDTKLYHNPDGYKYGIFTEKYRPVQVCSYEVHSFAVRLLGRIPETVSYVCISIYIHIYWLLNIANSWP